MYTDTDTDVDGRPPNRIEIDFRSTCYEKIPLWKSWASQGKVQEAIKQLRFLEKQTRPGTDTDTTARILVAIVQIYFEAQNWEALNEQVLLLARKRSQPKQAIVKMVQECLTFIDKIPGKDRKIKLIETLSFITEGKAYLEGETMLLTQILNKINEEERERVNVNEMAEDFAPVNCMEPTETPTPKRRKRLDSLAKDIVVNLHQYFNDLKTKDMSNINDTSATRLVVSSTGVPLRTVKRIIQENKSNLENGEQFGSSKRVRKRTFVIDDFDRAEIRQTIIDYYYEYYNKDQDFPTMTCLHEKMKDKINYSGSLSLLQKEVSLMGFDWKQTQGRSGILVEKNEIRFLRINFLTKVAQYRAQGRPIVFTGETYIDATRPSKSKLATKGNGLIIVHAGGMDGYIPDGLLMVKSNQKIADHPYYLKSEEYIKWMKHQLIPNLKPKSVVVVDNPVYLNIIHNPPPGPNALKQEMLDWLDDHDIVHSSSMLKPQLYQIILQHKDRFKEYEVESLLKSNNHSLLRLPPYHPELNPIRTLWPIIKESIGNNIRMNWVREKINSITLQDWKRNCDLAIKEEKKFIGHDAAIDTLTEHLSQNIVESSDESETEVIEIEMSESE